MEGDIAKLKIAIRAALTEFNNWNEITGVFDRGNSYLWEVESLIEDATEIGYGVGMGEPIENIIERIHKRNECIP